MFQRGLFLIITRDDALALTVSEPLQRYSVARRTASVREALPLLVPRARWSGVVLDLDITAATALADLVRIRRDHPLVPILALASSATCELINGVHEQRAELVIKPVAECNVVSFTQRALLSGWLPDARVSAWLDELSRRHDLTAREVQLIVYTLGNEPRTKMMRRLGITENTLKSQVRALLRKFGARSLDGLAKYVLSGALVWEREPGQEVSGPVEPFFSRTASA